jgi:hypothetical protein
LLGVFRRPGDPTSPYIEPWGGSCPIRLLIVPSNRSHWVCTPPGNRTLHILVKSQLSSSRWTARRGVNDENRTRFANNRLGSQPSALPFGFAHHDQSSRLGVACQATWVESFSSTQSTPTLGTRYSILPHSCGPCQVCERGWRNKTSFCTCASSYHRTPCEARCTLPCVLSCT